MSAWMILKHFRRTNDHCPALHLYRCVTTHLNKKPLPLMYTTVQAQIPSTINKNKGPVYTGTDIFLPRTKTCTVAVHLAFTRDQRNWKKFWTAKCTSLGPEKSEWIFWPARFQVCVDSCNQPNRATFCSDNAVKAKNLLIRLPPSLDTIATEFARIHVNRPVSQRIWTPRSISASGCGPLFADMDPLPNFYIYSIVCITINNLFHLQAFCQFFFKSEHKILY